MNELANELETLANAATVNLLTESGSINQVLRIRRRNAALNLTNLVINNAPAIVAALRDAEAWKKRAHEMLDAGTTLSDGVECADKTIATLKQQLAEARAEIEQLKKEHEALAMAHTEARDLLAEFDSTGILPRANIEALRALVWRADIKQGKVKHQ